jgi:YHS domain-containing protein
VTTACKGIIPFEVGTPTALFCGKRVYFCLTSCLKAFLDDPDTSCLADEIRKDHG